MNILDNSPITAIATAPGLGGIGVIRVSGKNLEGFIQEFFNKTLKPRYTHFQVFKDSNGQAIDEGLVIYFKGPNSYTGEDTVEFQGHGGPAVLKRVLERCLEVGKAFSLRLAAPGEFTQRAFLNGKLDLAQAEAVADLIEASSSQAAKSAMASLSGSFSKLVNQLSEKIVHLRMLVEATLDFPEEEIDFLEKYQAKESLQKIQADLDSLLFQAKQGLILREGLHIVLAGQPNVGKSSLLNALAGDDIAIVTDIAGTTRDKVTQLIHIEGIPLHIVDTAGLRETNDTVEKIGIERTWKEIEKANVIIHLQDARKQAHELDKEITERLPKNIPVLTVFNKIDLLKEDEISTLSNSSSSDTLVISAKSNIGLDQLKKQLLDIAGWKPATESPWLARERHVQALDEARMHLLIAQDHASQDDRVLDLFAEELRLAHDELTHITGQFTSDDLLGEIFSSFCIGK